MRVMSVALVEAVARNENFVEIKMNGLVAGAVLVCEGD